MDTTHLVTAAAYDLTTGRALTLVAIPFGVLGVVLGARALRAARLSPATGVASIVSLGLGTLILVTADGGPGSGSGVVGAVLAMVLGAAGMVLGGLGHLASIRNERRTRAPA
ncbi:peptidoglycan/LPS O-acetylase OafA/YrhL [Nocardioides thalensis]|uniref:Peptidoglycan/LPS O-acetylase OafA/YrhL n=1 Tax=Nocardioides thalensis TaxID=1914755 RepID=A0A853C7M0_9ACTN|nr:DUF6223 family protein [Nocardioides thalensis]NYJ02213.1 peptidoglycan/LPS O-acetylase OafA/YrhL [Nocardioides thalensis]